jgi:adenine-specific DNA-methyltransferase
MSANYDKLKALLRELFQMDQADLDFGLYRIMNAKRDEIERFLEHDLLPQVKTELARHTGLDSGAKKVELDKAIENATRLGANPDDMPMVQQLCEELKHGTDLDALENEVFSHLCNFFRRYYDQGDFLSLRRYKEGVYAIPYEGEEIKLYWANHDQYYIKSTEYLRDYTFKLRDNRRVHFKVVEADDEAGNNKAQNGKERRFNLVEANPLVVENGELFIRFNYKPDTRKQAELNTAAVTALLGNTSLTDWLSALSELRPSEKNPQRTMLAKHLDDFTARYAFDYFIHKDLGGFLRRELDFFIKNEIMHLDDVEDETAPKVQLYLSKIKALRKIAYKVIAFLEQLETFQKKMWLKKKFVVEANYCMTLDRVPEELYPQIIENKAQIDEWKRLLEIQEIEKTTVNPGYCDPLTVEFLKANCFLPLDTKFFSESFKSRLLASLDNVEAQLNGVLIRSDNFHALRLIQTRYCEKVDCIYIDPPYNTASSAILYKNDYKHSSWLALMASRCQQGRSLLTQEGFLCAAIDDVEFPFLRLLLVETFGSENVRGIAAVRANPAGRSTPTGFSVAHDYAVFMSRSGQGEVGRLERSINQLARYDEKDDRGPFEWVNFRKHGGVAAAREARRKMFFPFYASSDGVRIPKMEWLDTTKEWKVLEEPIEGEKVVLPINAQGEEKRWKWGIESVLANLTDFRAQPDQTGNLGIYFKSRMNEEGTLPITWWDKKEYSATEYGTNLLTDMFGQVGLFSFPKAVHLVEDCLMASALPEDGTVLDFFGGSATTAHAAINLNRRDQGERKFILIDVEQYFESVLKPRVQKVIYSKDWKNGKPLSREGSSLCFTT